jgi:SAM-dependent methyltransferase
MTEATNEAQVQYWNGEGATHWLAHEDRYERMLALFTDHVLGAAEVGRADRVIDLGCGCGATTLGAARLAADGQVLGADLFQRLLHRARQHLREAGLTNARFERADAQVHPFAHAGYDTAISRFGVMFFADPLAAFANVTRALRPGGRVAFTCWASLLANEWIAVPGAAVARYVDLTALGDPAQPGPFSLAGPDRLQALLGGAGLVEVALETVSESLVLGSDLPDTVAFLQSTGIGRALLADADSATAGRVTEALHAAVRPYLLPDGVRLGSKAWLVTARRPA